MDDELISTNIINNLIEVISIVVQFSIHQESVVNDIQGSLQYFSGCEFPFFNGVFNNYKNQKIPVKDDLSAMVNFFSEKNMPFIWWWLQQSQIPTEIKKELEERGFQFLGDYSGIAAKLDQVNINININHIKIKIVETDEEYNNFFTIICDVFQLSDSIKRDFKSMYRSYGPNGKFKHYLGFYAKEPIATLTSYISDKVVGLYNGATLPKAQKNGACSMLAINAIKDAMNIGCEYAVSQLMAPGMAKGLSEKLGSKIFCTLLPFLYDPRSNKIS